MLFERFGILCLSKIRPVFLFLLLSLPPLFAGIYAFQKQLEAKTLESQYETTLFKAQKSLHKKAEKERFFARYQDAQSYFIDQHLEGATFLQDEIDWLKAYEKHPALAETKLAQQRLSFLTGKNRISFAEEATRKGDLCEEVEEKMKRSVQMNEEDLKKILCLIENVKVGSYDPIDKSPQMIITDFSLKKKTSPFKQEIFEVKLNLLKREFKK